MRIVKEDLERFLRNVHLLARLVHQVLETGYLKKVSPNGLTFDQLNILKFLSRPSPCLVKDVSFFLNASYAAASKAVTRLEKKGLIRKRTLGSDRRAEGVEVTSSGHSYVPKYEKVKSERLAVLLKDSDVVALADELEKVI